MNSRRVERWKSNSFSRRHLSCTCLVSMDPTRLHFLNSHFPRSAQHKQTPNMQDNAYGNDGRRRGPTTHSRAVPERPSAVSVAILHDASNSSASLPFPFCSVPSARCTTTYQEVLLKCFQRCPARGEPRETCGFRRPSTSDRRNSLDLTKQRSSGGGHTP